jgi:hypothetical protein
MKTGIKGLDFIICGLEHSGTTLASDLFRQVPRCDSGFECGVLLCGTPREFPNKQPFYRNMLAGWKISEADLGAACATDSFSQFYDSVFKNAGVFEGESLDIRFEKTPRYITNLTAITAITEAPVIAMIKDPRAIAWSDFQRSKRDIEDIDNWYEEWMPPKKRYMELAYHGYLHAWKNTHCLVTRLEDLCLNTRNTFEQMFEHVGLRPSLEYLNIRDSRYPNTHGKSISISTAVQHLAILPQRVQERVRQDFGHLDRWFYTF